MSFDNTVKQKATRLEDVQGIPSDRALVKAEGTVVGDLAAVAGILAIFSAVGLALAVVLMGGKLTLIVGLVVGIVGFLGFALFAVGMTLISREAAPMIGSIGELLVKLVRAVRRKGNGT